MKPIRPDWYDKLNNGPFTKRRFTEAMMRQTEVRAKNISQAKRNNSSQVFWTSIIVACSLGIILSLNWDRIDPWLKASKLPISTDSPISTQTQMPAISAISQEEALQIAKTMDPKGDAQWSAVFQKNVQVEPSKPDKYEVWNVKALYTAGNTMTVTIDAISGKILSVGEGETPSKIDVTPGKTELFQDLDSLQMIDSNNGWAQTTHTILRTTDEGITWSDVTPADILIQSLNVEISAKFLDSKTAYLTVPNGSGSSITVYATNDGGSTWRKSEAVDKSLRDYPPQNPSLTFADKENGWILAPFDAAMGSSDTELFSTTDGGVTWNAIAGVTYGENNVHGYPLEGIKSGVAFADRQNGFLTGTTHGNGIWLFASHDGGLNWQKQVVSIPKGYSADGGSATSYPPQFFGGKDGILPVSFSTDQKRTTMFYVTHDSGKTWEQTTPLLPDRSVLEVWDFIDADHGFATDGANIYVTVNGAKSWTKHPLQGLDFESVHLDFVSEKTGFAIGKTQMYRTTDGGVTWELMKPMMKK
jgi:photosystem II stability/assembly factor-like uncharacterized protein